MTGQPLRPGMTLHDEHVLVVDDDALILEILTQQLESVGVGSVLVADSGDAALAMLAWPNNVTIVLTDLSMPEMDGPRFLRGLARLKCHARIVLVSGARSDIVQSVGELGRSLGLHMVGFIQKPVTPQVLKSMIEASERQLQPQRGKPGAPPPAQTTAATLDLSPERLAEAIRRGEIHPWYQPKVDAVSLRVVGLEALARWTLADGTMISPGSFVPAIEAAGMSRDLFFTMLDQVLADVKRWLARQWSLKVSVNLSMDCTHQLELPELIAGRLAAAEVPAENLVIEVTESGLMADRVASMETLTRLSLMGLTLSIDDFGTGYSSLAQLADLPFGELKVDAHFVRRAGLDPKADTILRTTVTFGRGLGMTVVAEGVERSSQLDVLRRMSTQVIQGFLIARPMPAARFERWLLDWRPGLVDALVCTRQPTLLIVDDSPSMREVIEAELRHRLHDPICLHAKNGGEALEIAGNNAIDMATVDYLMPGLDGLTLLQRLRDVAPTAKFVLLTANLSDDVARDCVALGAMYCPKPLTDAQADRIARHLRDV